MLKKSCPLKNPLTFNEMKTLFMLRECQEKEAGNLTRQKILSNHRMAQPSLYRSIAKLHGSDLIDISPNPEGKGNNQIIKITAKGISCLECHEQYMHNNHEEMPLWCFFQRL